MSVISMKQLLEAGSILVTKPEGGILKWKSIFLQREMEFILLTFKRL